MHSRGTRICSSPGGTVLIDEKRLNYKFQGRASKCHALQTCRYGCCPRLHLQRRSRLVERAESTLWAIRRRRIPETRACAEVPACPQRARLCDHYSRSEEHTSE